MSDIQILRVSISLSTGEYEASFRIPSDVARRNKISVFNLVSKMLDEAQAVISAAQEQDSPHAE